eukprot:scaffold43738_cov343-Skeletonema_marinoi.AAC.1
MRYRTCNSYVEDPTSAVVAAGGVGVDVDDDDDDKRGSRKARELSLNAVDNGYNYLIGRAQPRQVDEWKEEVLTTATANDDEESSEARE